MAEVFAQHQNVLEIELGAATGNYVAFSNQTELTQEISNSMDEWKPIGQDGFTTTFIHGKKYSLGFNMKYTNNDAVCEYLETLHFGNAVDQNDINFRVILPIKDSTNDIPGYIQFVASVEITSFRGGDSDKGAQTIEGNIHVNGRYQVFPESATPPA